MIEWKSFPETFRHFYDELDPKQPYVSQLIGGYRQELTIESGETRPLWVYYPQGLMLSSYNVTILLPNGADAGEFLEQSGWRKLADEKKLLLLLAGGKASPWGVEGDDAYLKAVLREEKNRKYMDTKQPIAYLCAYGKSAEAAHRFLLAQPFEYAGAVFAGRVESSIHELESLGALTYRETELTYRDISCPVVFTDVSNAALAYWRSANTAEDIAYLQGDMDIWLPRLNDATSPLEHRPCARTQIYKGEDVYTEKATRAFVDFLLCTVRGTGINYGDLHPNYTADDMGLTYHEIEVDGYMRYWYEYVPERQHVLTDGKLPLVLYCHGGSASPISDGINHLWTAAAKERGFVVLYPAGTMRVSTDMMPHPAWNAANLNDHMDDLKFIRAMLENVYSRLPIDRERMYVNGHSMGSAMAQRIALTMPDVFAAAAGNSGVTKGGFMGDFDTPGVREDYDIPLWVQMGEHDIGGGTMENNPSAKRAMQYWADRYDLPNFDEPDTWRDGRYLNKEWHTTSGVPMLRYTTTLEKPHCITPQDPFFYYDQFFCFFSRRKDGTLCYKGKPVRRDIV